MTAPKDHPHWKRMQFKNNKVWMAVDSNGDPLPQNGKVLIKYQISQPYEYWVKKDNLVDLKAPPTQAPEPEKSPKKLPDAGREPIMAVDETDQNAIRVFTDGACSGNPGPAGIGIVFLYKDKQKEISRAIGAATNNIAELEAIRVALASIKDKKKPVLLYTDSNYAIGVLTKGWKAKQNIELVAEIRKLAASFSRLSFIKVKGHAGHRFNELADRLAVRAIA